ncbi:MAG: SulP family inorganic anion transporter [Bacteroidia bacterium]|nr:SulP family inorganic anion transporter [Bacteroidia bacterium]NNF31042.1 SulP family inorganic anion transporter [Flavobacteriaceae bacterium]MBT8274574.1 SulP family inorganic anion transporter [Bacteroidia bacterium]NNJ81568.1 SulP family inorganic anion transporter [Flavobacteriaceae bacterium]NNK53963.1 SulP family inorganic anion transporter [Flavobacteriaceae bacterium]
MFKNIFTNIRGNLFGGITAGIVALPLALAFGVQSGLGPDAGLYGAIFIGFFASLFGGTNTQISGPTAPMTALSMVIIAGIIGANDGDVAKALPFILMVFLLAGLIQILIGVVGWGKYIKYIPYPVVSGFMTAIGVIILVTQVLPVLGYYAENDSEFINEFKPQAEEILLDNILKDEAEEGILVLEDFKETVRRADEITEEEIIREASALAKNKSSGVIGSLNTVSRAVKNVRWLEVALAFLTIFLIYTFRRITKKIPATLIALLVVSAGAILLKLDYQPIKEIPAGFPMPNLDIFANFSVSQISPYIFTAITLAFLGAIDSLLTSIVADNMTKTKHKPNQELIGQGIGNSLAAIFGGLPGAGATIRTVVNINSGGTTKLSGMVAAVLLVVILLLLGPIASQIPAAVLAGILVTVGIGVMDYKGLKAIPNMPISEVIVMLVVLVLSVFWNLIYAVGIGLVLASLIFMKKLGDATAARSQIIPLSDADENDIPWKDERGFPKELKEEVYIKHLDGPMFFGNTNDFHELAKGIPDTASHVIIRMDKVPYMDQSGLYAMEETLYRFSKTNITAVLVHLERQPRVMMESIDIIPDLLPPERIFEDFDEVLVYLNENVEDVV